MAISDDDLNAFELALSEIDLPAVGSLSELLRQQEVRAALAFGDSTPTFRTRVSLRFTGKAVRGHDLEGHVAGTVVEQFTAAVHKAGMARSKTGAGLNLFLSPTVRPGSTVLELVGESLPLTALEEGTYPLNPEHIPDTPVDRALQELFRTLAKVDPNAPGDIELDIDGDLGKGLFKLSNTIIDQEIDLGITWQRPRGTTATTDFSRAKARTLRDALNKDTVKSETKRVRGRVTSISLKGQFHVQVPGQRTIPLVMPEERREELRQLWGKEVLVEYKITTLSHPNRNDSKPTYDLLNISVAPHKPEQSELGE